MPEFFIGTCNRCGAMLGIGSTKEDALAIANESKHMAWHAHLDALERRLRVLSRDYNIRFGMKLTDGMPPELRQDGQLGGGEPHTSAHDDASDPDTDHGPSQR